MEEQKHNTPSDFSAPWLFIGLGNPGREYENTRHNIGFCVIDSFASSFGCSLKKDLRFNAMVFKGLIENRQVHLLQPLTYMNLSGSSVKRYADYFKIPVDQIVVVLDDIGLPFGQLLMKPAGSSGGHNGLKSLESHLGTSRFLRLRMGVGHPGEKMLADYVLEPFNLEETRQLSEFIDQGVDTLRALLKQTASYVMNKINTLSRQKRSIQNSDAEQLELTKPPRVGEEKV